MKKLARSVSSIVILLSLIAPQVVWGQVPAGGKIAIQASPQTIILDRAPPSGSSGNVWMTIHADIDFSQVDRVSVTLEGVAAFTTFADNRGDLVAKFIYSEIAKLVLGDAAELTLTLTGTTREGEDFWGEDVVRVVRW
jgi:hypothetical protein